MPNQTNNYTGRKCHLHHFVVTTRNGTCGIRQLRQPFRTKVAKILNYKSAERYRIEQAEKLMSPRDHEPSILPKAMVLFLNISWHWILPGQISQPHMHLPYIP